MLSHLNRLMMAAALVAALASWTAFAKADEADDAALRTACFNLDIGAVKAALNSGADPNGISSDKNPATPINQTLMGLLTSKGPDVEARGLEILKTLTTRGAKVGPFDRDNVFFAISRGYNQVIQFMLGRGTSPTKKLEGYTPAELAIKYGQPATYQLLIKNGASKVGDQGIKQLTLLRAIDDIKPDQVIAAVKDGAIVNGQDPSGLTPLVAALSVPIYWPEQVQIVEWLIDRGADVNQESRQQRDRYVENETPLNEFVRANSYTMNSEKQDVRDLSLEVMRYLLKAGAKVSGKDAYGSTPLHEAARANNLAAAKILIDEGAKIRVKDMDGKSPLDYAENGAMIKFLKSQGATE